MNPFFPIDPAKPPPIRPFDEIAGCNLPVSPLRDQAWRPREPAPPVPDGGIVSPPGDDCWLRR